MRNALMGALALTFLAFGAGCKGNLKSSACTPQCGGKECGSDGCGGTCGECGPSLQCNLDGTCENVFCGNGRLEANEACDYAIAAGDGVCETTCADDGNACTSEEFFGNPQNCDAECRITTIIACQSGDGCCPAGCSTNDSDCSLTCGNGTVEDNETCELDTCPRDAATDCPVPTDACKVSIITGGADNCSAQCAEADVTECIDDDGCCPSECGVDDDNDCEFVCGDGQVTGPEACDNMITAPDEGFCPTDAAVDCNDDEACTSDEIAGMADDCSAACVNVAITDLVNGDGCCPPNGTPDTDDDCMAVCGNNVVEAGETCDNAIVAPNAGFCPPDAAACDDSDACTTDVFAGDPAQCTAECTNDPVMMPTAADGCCYFAGTVMQEITDCQSLCDDYCTMATTFCVDYDGAGTNLYNDDDASGDAMDECQAACAAFQFKIRDAGSATPADDDGNNSLYCRIYHLGLADPNVDAMGPMTHCPHAAEVSAVCNVDL